jgi:hypothetical protein
LREDVRGRGTIEIGQRPENDSCKLRNEQLSTSDFNILYSKSQPSDGSQPFYEIAPEDVESIYLSSLKVCLRLFSILRPADLKACI